MFYVKIKKVKHLRFIQHWNLRKWEDISKSWHDFFAVKIGSFGSTIIGKLSKKSCKYSHVRTTSVLSHGISLFCFSSQPPTCTAFFILVIYQMILKFITVYQKYIRFFLSIFTKYTHHHHLLENDNLENFHAWTFLTFEEFITFNFVPFFSFKVKHIFVVAVKSFL